ncbi:DUF3658 domain-containing protein [Atopobium fossor]|uniref:DUF3658 domain-containing protein n=1 Tax=Atopobium fossor TaxID=39487 RepID=UPI0004157DBF|nr:DUF3658 domain-containing protein [Atopobium fossor]
MLVDVFFDSTSESILKLAAQAGFFIEETAVFPDDVTIGSITTMTPKNRKSELVRRGYSVDQDFEQRYKAFLNTITQAKALRIWMLPYPHASLGLLYISSLVDLQTRIQSIKGIERINPSVLWLDDAHVNTAPLSELMDAGCRLEQKTCAKQWQEFVKENASFRIMPNGVPMSCDEDIFDKDIIAFCRECNLSEIHKLSGEKKGYELQNIAISLSELMSVRTGGMLNPDFYLSRIAKLINYHR